MPLRKFSSPRPPPIQVCLKEGDLRTETGVERTQWLSLSLAINVINARQRVESCQSSVPKFVFPMVMIHVHMLLAMPLSMFMDEVPAVQHEVASCTSLSPLGLTPGRRVSGRRAAPSAGLEPSACASPASVLGTWRQSPPRAGAAGSLLASGDRHLLSRHRCPGEPLRKRAPPGSRPAASFLPSSSFTPAGQVVSAASRADTSVLGWQF